MQSPASRTLPDAGTSPVLRTATNAHYWTAWLVVGALLLVIGGVKACTPWITWSWGRRASPTTAGSI